MNPFSFSVYFDLANINISVIIILHNNDVFNNMHNRVKKHLMTIITLIIGVFPVFYRESSNGPNIIGQ